MDMVHIPESIRIPTMVTTNGKALEEIGSKIQENSNLHCLICKKLIMNERIVGLDAPNAKSLIILTGIVGFRRKKKGMR